MENPASGRGYFSSPEFRFAGLFAAGTFLIYLAFTAPGIYSLDGNSMLAVAESIVAHHSVTVPSNLGIAGIGGRIYSAWYPLLSILAVPFAYVALWVSGLLHLPFHYVAAELVLPISAALSAGTAGCVALLSTRIGATRRGAWIAAVSFAFGTIALVYARTFFAEPLLAFVAAAALYLAFGRSRKEIFLASCCAALAVLAKPTGIILGPVLAAYLMSKRVRLRLSVLPVAGAAVGFAVYAAYNLLRFGHPMTFGQPWAFGFAFIGRGIAGLVASPGWGLLWYCPTMILAAWGFRQAMRSHFALEALAIMAVFAGFLFVHSLWHDWSAGWAWGPRYLLPAIPGLCALTGLLEGKGKKALLVLVAAGFVLNAPTTFSFYERYLSELAAQGYRTDEGAAWSFERAPFLHAWPAAVHEAQDARRSDVREIFAERGNPSRTIESSRALRVVAVWWWVLPIAGIPRWVGVVLSLLLVSAGVWLIGQSRIRDALAPEYSTRGQEAAAF